MNDFVSRRWGIVYGLLLVLRLFSGTTLIGYIHPDEFFQGGQELFFGGGGGSSSSNNNNSNNNHSIPWEFEQEHAVRSIVPPMFMSWLPLRVYHYVFKTNTIGGTDNDILIKNWKSDLSGWEVWIVPRIFLTFLSAVTVDLCVWTLTVGTKRHTAGSGHYDNEKGSMPLALFILATSWPALVFLSRPFSNSLETMCLAVLWTITMRGRRQRKGVSSAATSFSSSSMMWTTDLAVGATSAFGFFTRFTFSFFSVPIIISYLWRRTGSHYQTKKRAFFLRLVPAVAITAIGFLATASILVYADVVYYHGKWSLDHALQYVTPFNAFLYNSQSQNLAHHGLHPRVTHALVNLPMLFGPLAIGLYLHLGNGLWSILTRSRLNDKSGCLNLGSDEEMSVKSMCYWVISMGLGVLSMAPHQEPRFLLPLLLPMTVLFSDMTVNRRSQRRIILVVWFLFNAALIFFFGVLHQGGVVPSLLELPNVIPTYSKVLFFRTYMPPTFLARSSSKQRDATQVCVSGSSCDGEFTIIDLKGSTVDSLMGIVDSTLHCHTPSNELVYVVSPTVKENNVHFSGDSCAVGIMYQCNTTWTHRPHVTTEDLPPWRGSLKQLVSDLQLSVYTISCAKSG